VFQNAKLTPPENLFEGECNNECGYNAIITRIKQYIDFDRLTEAAQVKVVFLFLKDFDTFLEKESLLKQEKEDFFCAACCNEESGYYARVEVYIWKGRT
jgi:ATP-dependent Clp protease ATP-binding subunit ClpA